MRTKVISILITRRDVIKESESVELGLRSFDFLKVSKVGRIRY